MYWNKIVYNSSSDGRNPCTTYDYMIFEGKFLGQETLVYAVRLEGTDILSIEHELNKLINCSFKSICKLYYYTRNTDFLLIITEKVRPITRADPKEIFACRKPY